MRTPSRRGRFLRIAACGSCLWMGAGAAKAQFQPNSPTASLLVNGEDGSLSAATIGVPHNSTMTIRIGGTPVAPFAVFFSSTGLRTPASASYFGGQWDLPAPADAAQVAATTLVNGFLGVPVFFTTSIGERDLHYFVQAVSTLPGITGVPVGFLAAFQGVVADASSPFGLRVTGSAAAETTNGPTKFSTTLGDSGDHLINLASSGFTIPFYGVAYSSLYLNADGYVTFGVPVQDFSSSPAQFYAGPPRIAGFWADLDSSAIFDKPSYEIVAPSGGEPGFVRMQYSGTADWAGLGFSHWFAMTAFTDGVVVLEHPFSNHASIFETFVGIGKGSTGTPLGTPQIAFSSDLSALDGSNTAFGVNQPIWEWFGQTTMPSYLFNVNRPYDLQGRTLVFTPSGPATSPTSSYTVN